MRRLFAALGLIAALFLSAPAEAAWVHVQTKVGAGSSGGTNPITCTVTPTAALTNGNTAIISLYLLWPSGGSASGFSATDNAGGTYVQAAVYNADTQHLVLIFVNPNVTGSPTTVSITANTGGASPTSKDCVLDEFSGGTASSAVDGTAAQKQVNPGTTADAVSSGNLTTAGNGDLIYAVSYSINTATLPTAGTGYTRWTATAAGASTFYMASESQVQSAAGAIAGTFTDAAATNTAITAAFGLTVGGGAGNRSLGLLGVGS
jgi:hypothetical protein